jgi:membrane protein implicated in regulation of membrane protease activity
MENHLVWLVAAFSLVIVELVTGTFYLLVLGVAGFAGAAVAAAGLDLGWQALTAAIVAIAGVVWVHHWRAHVAAAASPFSVDAGQPAVFDSWISRASGHARMKYRDALWDAVVQEALADEPRQGEVFYVVTVDGNTLKVSKTRPA